jgi:hypothetical protein
MADFNTIITQLNTATQSLKNFLDAGNDLNSYDFSRSFGQSSKSLDDIASAAKNAGGILKEVADSLGGLTSNLGVGGQVIGGFTKGVGSFANTIASFSGDLLRFAESAADAFDAPSEGIRLLERNLFDLDKRFGESAERSAEFQKAFDLESGSRFAQMLHLSTQEQLSFIQATSSSNLTLDQLFTNIQYGTENIKLYQLATGVATATGLGYGTVVSSLNKLMNEQGMSAQHAASTLGMYSDISQKTGLQIDDVVSTLERSVSSFSKLGMTVEFGRPALEGFARMMKDVGLGISQATDLANTLTSTLGGLATNYTNAYLVFQRGNMDLSSMSAGGGVLGASIGMQAAMLRAEKEPGAQSEMASQLVTGLRDTLASFAGGKIVTVEEAAESPGLQTQFYIQQQMLKNQFGVSDEASANRILDLLSRLGEATEAGDADSVEALQKQIEEETKSRDATMDASEVVARRIDAHIAVTRAGYREQLLQGHEIIRKLTNSGIEKAEEVIGGSPDQRADMYRLDLDKKYKGIFSISAEEEAVLAEAGRNMRTNREANTEAAGTTMGTARPGEIPMGNITIKIDLSPEASKFIQVTKMMDRAAGDAQRGTGPL